ncbi:MAG: aminopeptidase P family protein [Desulfuromonadaceae bacterium]|nr:aminopeptidase P family protein [Desulfuromonadaceae bacterium]
MKSDYCREDLLHRQQRASRLLTDGLDAVVFFDLHSVRYLCGFTGTDGVVVVSAEGVEFLTDSRYVVQAAAEVLATRITRYNEKNSGIADCLKRVQAQRVGYEANAITCSSFAELENQVDVAWVGMSAELNAMRALKSPAEIAAIESATTISAQAFAAIEPLLTPGQVERDIALELEIEQRRLGADARAFEFIVASGERGALPHGVASTKRLAAGELVTIDFGCRFAGYHSDETVTVAIGDISARLRTIYDTVLEAHDRALQCVAPGVPLREIDAVARDYIGVAGYSDYFGHGLGHGVGLKVHEAPVVSPRSESLAEVGMVFTIEPGIYIPGCGGVRIEDMVVVTDDGCRTLTRIPKKFRCWVA